GLSHSRQTVARLVTLFLLACVRRCGAAPVQWEWLSHDPGGEDAGTAERNMDMKGHLALPAIAALALAAVCVSLPLRAAENPPQLGTIVTVAGTGSSGYSG